MKACIMPQAISAGRIGKTQATMVGRIEPKISFALFFFGTRSASRFSSIAAVLSTPDALTKASYTSSMSLPMMIWT